MMIMGTFVCRLSQNTQNTASLWCASVYRYIMVSVFFSFPMKCMFAPLNLNNEVTIV